MQKPEKYKYYSTQRPVSIGTFPKDHFKAPIRLQNYDGRLPVEGGAFRAWGEVIYRSPLTPDQMDQYELRPSRDNPDVRRTMTERAQVVGRWEDRNGIHTNRRLTRCIGISAYVCGDRVTPEELAKRYRLAEDIPFVSRRGPRPKKSPQIEGR